MKFEVKFVLLMLLVALSFSCTRQLTNISRENKLQTVSSIEKTNETNKPSPFSAPEPKIESQKVTVEKCHTTELDTPLLESKTTKETQNKYGLSEGAKKIFKSVIAYPPAFNLLQRHVTDRDYPQINKGGLILIGAGILAFVLHLIIYACIALVVLGLIVLLSPLFRKRY